MHRNMLGCFMRNSKGRIALVEVVRVGGTAGPAPVLEKRLNSKIGAEPNNPKVPEN